VKFLGWFFSLLIGLPILLGGGTIFYEAWHTYTYCFRLTIDVEADGRLYTSSGVMKGIVSSKAEWVPGIGSGRQRMIGEAVIVDMGDRGTLFATLADTKHGTWAEQIVYRTFPITRILNGNVASETIERAAQIYSSERMSANLDIAALPMRLVRFRDPSDPRTVETVDPLKLAANFGEHISLRRVILETVNSGWWPLSLLGLSGEPVTVGVGQRLPWLSAHPEPPLDQRLAGTKLSNSAARPLVHGDFRKGKL
jgi:hypothetical protein